MAANETEAADSDAPLQSGASTKPQCSSTKSSRLKQSPVEAMACSGVQPLSSAASSAGASAADKTKMRTMDEGLGTEEGACEIEQMRL